MSSNCCGCPQTELPQSGAAVTEKVHKFSLRKATCKFNFYPSGINTGANIAQ